ncbi:MAG: thermonuclease family protein [Candidatus Aceula lacicola]|nr:thermonuclease family protein [Candidatus Aceula lacicola]
MPELNTQAGQKAKHFVENTLKDCKFVIVQTHKSDKYDRYLANIFFLPNETDANVVARTGKLLNQELLNNNLAQKYA